MTRIRVRTILRSGLVPGQPRITPTQPEVIPSRPERSRHFCGECFGPRIAHGSDLFCHRCLDRLFGWQYENFLRSEARRQRRLRTLRNRASR